MAMGCRNVIVVVSLSVARQDRNHEKGNDMDALFVLSWHNMNNELAHVCFQ